MLALSLQVDAVDADTAVGGDKASVDLLTVSCPCLTLLQFGNLFVLRLPSEVSKDVEADASIARFRCPRPPLQSQWYRVDALPDTTIRTSTAALTRWIVWPRFTAVKS